LGTEGVSCVLVKPWLVGFTWWKDHEKKNSTFFPMIPAGYQVSWKNGEKKRAGISKNVMHYIF